MKTVITARAARFPGADTVEAYWKRILEAEPAPLRSFEDVWRLNKSQYYSTDGAVDRTYLDQAYGLGIPYTNPSDDHAFGDEGRQLAVGKTVLDELLEGKSIDRTRTALVLGTSWSDAHYLAADTRMMVFGQTSDEARQGQVLDPSGQVDELARHFRIGGPRFAIDTACASSLYALAAADRILAQDQADHVIVLGLNAYLPSFLFIGFSKIQAMSRTASLQPFSEDANGIVLGEGVGAVLLEKVATAKKYGRKPLAVVRAIGLSADGREGSVFTPGREGQKLAYERAYANTPRHEIDYIEAHGTGTPLGDAAEIDCLGGFFQAAGVKDLPLGSVKSLIGHSLAAAGIASLIKGLEILRTHTIPPHIKVRPSTRLKDSCLKLNFEAKIWDISDRPMRVGINSLGFGGANAHVVLEEWREHTPYISVAKTKTTRVALVAADIRLGETEIFPDRPDHEGRTYPPGLYLSGEHSLDLRNLGVGPAQANRLDPFLAVLTHQTAQVFQQASSPLSDKTAVIVCTNFGSEMALRQTRRFQANCVKSERRKEPSMSVEAITSTLPALSSGFPAASINLRGLHMTISGSKDIFWNLLLHIHSWFDTGLECILIGASSFIKSPYDLASRSQAMPREGSAAFALVPEHLAGDRALLWLESLPNPPAESKIINLEDETKYDLGEVTGIDTLESYIKAKPGQHALVVKRGEQIIGSVRITRTEKEWKDASSPPPEHAVSVSLGKIHALQTSALPAQSVQDLVQWHKELSDLMIFALESRARVQTSLLGQTPPTVTLPAAKIRRAAKNEVLRDAAMEGKEFRAQLVVDETHPYFFDHPLDHVPGILLFEAAVQLTEKFLALNPVHVQGRFIAHAAISFKRYTESHVPTDLKLSVSGDQILIQATQTNTITCLITLTLKKSERMVFTSVPYPSNLEVPDQTILHKHKPENMLVARIEKVEEERYQAVATPLGEGHFFHDGDESHHSLVYLLEVARQSMMQLAHLVMGIPLGTPMNLVDLKLSLLTPVPRQHVLILESTKSRVFEADDNLIARIITAFKIGDQKLGQVEITAQVMKKEYYLKQRGKTFAPKPEGT